MNTVQHQRINPGNAHTQAVRHFFHFVLDAFFPPPVKFEAKFPGPIEPLWGFHSAQVFEYDDVTAMFRRELHNFMACVAEAGTH
ncbi:hypothetical protein [Domibacillus robiginosus]|uniref:hypothetical protein n=1 Tax=Domibacillus robiginosus TaxID=1071054 RepID=UPI0012E01A34|nr:hypothetical protein [Domibacillus robiginosus]